SGGLGLISLVRWSAGAVGTSFYPTSHGVRERCRAVSRRQLSPFFPSYRIGRLWHPRMEGSAEEGERPPMGQKERQFERQTTYSRGYPTGVSPAPDGDAAGTPKDHRRAGPGNRAALRRHLHPGALPPR